MMQVRGEMGGKVEKMRNVILLNLRYSGSMVVAGFVPGTEAICSHYLRILFPQVIRGGLASERFVHGKINLIIKNTCVYSQNVCHSFDVINM